jgi:hypothetical protein
LGGESQIIKKVIVGFLTRPEEESAVRAALGDHVIASRHDFS